MLKGHKNCERHTSPGSFSSRYLQNNVMTKTASVGYCEELPIEGKNLNIMYNLSFRGPRH